MRDALDSVLADRDGDDDVDGTDRILAAAFFRKRPLQAGVVPISNNLVCLETRRGADRASSRSPGGPDRLWGRRPEPFFRVEEKR